MSKRLGSHGKRAKGARQVTGLPFDIRATTTLGDYFTSRQEPGRAGIPTVSVTMHDGLVQRDELERRMESTLAPEQHLLVRKGDIAYNMMRMWQGACGLAEADAIVSPAYVVLTPKSNIDSRFAVYWLKSPRILYLLWAYSHGLTEDRLRLYFDDFCQIPATPPPLEEQRRIVAALEPWDDAARVTDGLAARVRERRVRLARHLLNPIGRKRGRLGDLATINPRTPRLACDALVAFVAMEDVSELGCLVRFRECLRGDLGNGFTGFQEKDVLVAKITPCFENGKGAHVTGLRTGFGFGSTEFHVLRAHDPEDARFIHHLVTDPTFRRDGERYMTGSAGQRRVPAEFIEDYRITILSPAERVSVARILDVAETQELLLSEMCDRLDRQKRGFMQRLFTNTALDQPTLAPPTSSAAATI